MFDLIDSAVWLNLDAVPGPDWLATCRGNGDIKKRGGAGAVQPVPEPPGLVEDVHGPENGGGHGIEQPQDGHSFHQCLPKTIIDDITS